MHIGYRNAGTFEFLVGPDGAFSFIELNARLQVEHPVTELVTRLDLVRHAGRASRRASALPLTGRAPRSGHAIEIRINAEDPSRDFAPVAGHARRASARRSAPACASTRSSRTAASIPPYYDSLIAKVIVRDDDARRCASSARAARCASSTSQGVPTTRDAAFEILGSDEFRSGDYSTSFLEEAGAKLPALAGA